MYVIFVCQMENFNRNLRPVNEWIELNFSSLVTLYKKKLEKRRGHAFDLSLQVLQILVMFFFYTFTNSIWLFSSSLAVHLLHFISVVIHSLTIISPLIFMTSSWISDYIINHFAALTCRWSISESHSNYVWYNQKSYTKILMF